MDDEKQRLSDAVDRFAEAMKKRLFEKADEGFRGWDDLNYNMHDGVQIRMFRKASFIWNLTVDGYLPSKVFIDVANFIMMLWLHHTKKEAKHE